MLRLSVAGAGLMGARHIELIERSPACNLASIVDPHPSAQEMARRLDVPWYASIESALADGRPDGAVVATPSQLHLAHVLTYLKAGVPTLVEKPIATTVDDGIRVAQLAEELDVPILVGHHRRHSAILRAARGVVRGGLLGTLVAVTGAALFRKPDDYFDDAPWRRAPGGGPIMINLVHEVDDLRYLCGEITAVQAMSSSAARGYEVEDTVAINLAFDNGALGAFMLSDAAASPVSWELTSQENSAYPSVSGVDCYLLAGTAGALGVPTMRVMRYEGMPSWWEPLQLAVVDVQRNDPLEDQLAHFCEVIRREADPIATARDGVQNLIVAEAVAHASRVGGRVDTPVPEF